ncbi:MAG: dihydrofolate reductase [Microscillaceae bacterium]|jgi:dihydrofolate reductase|nr:dihydrofolate reductase [Microscillaceae bacterium]
MSIALIVAVAQNGVIGGDNRLLWHLPDDLKNFKRLTTGKTVVMGRKTYESIGKPLPNRQNVILSKQPDYQPFGTVVLPGMPELEIYCQKELLPDEELFVIGGGEIYALFLPLASKIYLTQVHTQVAGDTYFPALSPEDWQIIEQTNYQANEKNDFDFSIIEMVRV